MGSDPLPKKFILMRLFVMHLIEFFLHKDRLVVPNRNVPDFGVLKTLKGEQNNFKSVK